MALGRTGIEHVLRRAGFGASPDDLKSFDDMSTFELLDFLIDFEKQPDDVDANIGNAAYIGVVGRGGAFAPNTNIEDARQRWLFRMVHSRRPLQEKMALFWHNHFATAYSKISGAIPAASATKVLALKPGDLPGPRGQYEMFRAEGMGSFRDLLIEVARDPAMLVWLDGRNNTRRLPQENFGREIMELFTMGVGNYTEQDVYAAARVFTGWNLRFVNRGDDTQSYYEYAYIPANHEPTAKTFTFPIYGNGDTTIPARPAADGEQDGIDFITALAHHPATARRLARKLWNFFVSEVVPPDEATLNAAVSVYLSNGTRIAPLVTFLLRSRDFLSPSMYFTRYSWPVEFAVRAIKEVGWTGFTVDAVRAPLTAMGQTLFEPPDVAGWELGQGWFSTGAMVARMNYAATLAANQRFNLARAAAGAKDSPESLMDFLLDRLSVAPYDKDPRGDLLTYAQTVAAWTGSDAQVQAKAAGLTRLIVGSSEYQIV
ncbi:MAG TPA: DUF1800 domain-containing protein [Vicinamibacterales bacterium]|nr:DUF1800 domain-containing protein [Vicinamibacterales bacterium]